mgnify:CR=1 FL=1
MNQKNSIWKSKKIIHVDMDCFYASVEIRDNPQYINKPVAVAGSSESRGVVTTCNYIARKFGVKVSDIKRWNNLKNDNIKENQKLIVFPKRIPKN